MKLNRDEVAKLSRLCAVQLNQEEEAAFLMKLESVIELIGKLSALDLKTQTPWTSESTFLSTYQPMKTPPYEDPAVLLSNVKHPIKANMIQIKSPLAN